MKYLLVKVQMYKIITKTIYSLKYFISKLHIGITGCSLFISDFKKKLHEKLIII